MRAAHSYKRNWRFHKPTQQWLMPASGGEWPSALAAQQPGTYVYFSTDTWQRATKEMLIGPDQIEDRPAVVIK